MRDISGKTTFVTGGASGIGLGMDEAREALALELIPGLAGSPIYRET